MTSTAKSSSIPLAELRQMMEAVARPGPRRDVLPFGISGMDEALPGGGLALGAVHEFCEDGARGGYAASALLFTAGILARLEGPGPLVSAQPRPFRAGTGAGGAAS